MRYNKLLVSAVAAALIIGGATAWALTRHKKPVPVQANPFTQNSNQNQTNGITDTKGQTSTTNPNSQTVSPNPVKSASGLITLDQPTAGAKLSTGTTVSGQAKVNQVQYRIKDNVRGVIGQGSLEVTNGKFSGTLSIQASGSSGTFEVYSFNPQSGAEENSLKINVAF